MPHRLRILHVSDLHARGPLKKTAWRWAAVLNDFLSDGNTDRIQDDGPIDLVCFTGDATFSGRSREYREAEDIFASLLDKLELPRDRFFIVPGNHDIRRKTNRLAWKALRNTITHDNARQVSEWMAGAGSAPPGIDANHLPQTLSRQRLYRLWLRRLDRRALLPTTDLHPTLGYRVTMRMPGHPFETHIIGLDTAWLAGDRDDIGKLWLSEDQVGCLTTDTHPLEGFRLALAHHPLSDLADGSRCRRLLGPRVDLLLRGHLHEPVPMIHRVPPMNLREVAAGCLYEHNRYPNSFQVIQIDLDDAGRPQAFRFHFRSWSAHEHWYDDNSILRGSRGGRIALDPDFHPIVGETDQPHARAQMVFVKRYDSKNGGDALEIMRQALLPGKARRPVYVVGMPGVGKSYLIDRFFVENADNFRNNYIRLVLDPLHAETAGNLIGHLANRLGCSARAEEIQARLLAMSALLHIENVDDRVSATRAADVVKALVGCPVVLSGRYQELGRDGGWVRVSLAPFDVEVGVKQLELEVWDTREDRDGWPMLVRELGGLPLALHLAAGHLRSGMSAQGFLTDLRELRQELQLADPSDPLWRDPLRANLAATFDLSLDLLRRSTEAGDEQVCAIHALGHGPPDGFGSSLGAAICGLDEQAFEKLAVGAVRLSILARGSLGVGTPAWILHPLLAERLRFTDSEKDNQVIARVTDWFIARLPRDSASGAGRNWGSINTEIEALVWWLERLPPKDCLRVEEAGRHFAGERGPFLAWQKLCERILKGELPEIDRSNVLLTLAHVAFWAGHYDAAMDAAKTKIELDRRLGDLRGAAFALAVEADVHQTRGQSDEALRILRDEILPVLKHPDDSAQIAHMYGRIADICETSGDGDEANRIRNNEVLPTLDLLGDKRSKAIAKEKIAGLSMQRGRWDEAREVLQNEVLPVYKELEDVRSTAIANASLMRVLTETGDLEKAAQLVSEVGPVLQRLGDARAWANATVNFSAFLVAIERYDEAIQTLREQVCPIFQAIGDERLLIIAQTNLGLTLLRRGGLNDQEDAQQFLRLALSGARRLEMPEADMIGKALSEANLDC